LAILPALREGVEMTLEEIKKRIEEWEFASCPIEQKEPFFWRWTEEGKKQLAEYIVTFCHGLKGGER